MRASNEHIPIVRVREQEDGQAAPSPSFSGRALRERRRSTGRRPTHPLREQALPKIVVPMYPVPVVS